MSLAQIVVIALIQGITEFLPISSSGHLLLIPAITGWPDQGLMVDVMVHMGSLLAVFVYFWRDILRLIGGTLDLLRGRMTEYGRIALFILIGTIPAIIVGLALDKLGFMDAVRHMPQIVAWNAIIFGILMYVCDRYGMMWKSIEEMTLWQAIIIGIAQALALNPGTSRSGVTMTAARALGFKRSEAARFSFLLGIPAIAGAGVQKLGTAIVEGHPISGDAVLTAFLTFLVALGAIAFLMRLIRHHSLLPFTIYRVILGICLLVLIYGGYLGAVTIPD